MLFEGGVDRVEAAHDLEILAQGRFPVGTVIVVADLVDQRQAGPAGPAQDVHFRFVFTVVGHRAIHHVDDAGAFHDGTQQLALVVITGIVRMLGDEGRHGFRTVGGGQAVALQPGQHLAGTLEPGSVDQLVEGRVIHLHGVAVAVAGGARLHGDGNGVVLGQGGHHAGLALVGVADHGKAGLLLGRFVHGCSCSLGAHSSSWLSP